MAKLFLLNGISATTAMVALSVGYIALVLAKKESGILKVIGNIIGVFVMIASILLILIKVAFISSCPYKSERFLMRQKMTQERMMPVQLPPTALPKK